jgi:hypothetical protein
VQAQGVACLARQSCRVLVLDDQRIPPPRRLRQRSRLNVKQAMQTITKLLKQASQHINHKHHN